MCMHACTPAVGILMFISGKTEKKMLFSLIWPCLTTLHIDSSHRNVQSRFLTGAWHCSSGQNEIQAGKDLEQAKADTKRGRLRRLQITGKPISVKAKQKEAFFNWEMWEADQKAVR